MHLPSANASVGADRLLNIHSPSKLPKGLSHVQTPPSDGVAQVAKTFTRSSSNPDVGNHQSLEHPTEREGFEVQTEPENKKPLKTKAQREPKPRRTPKPKFKPKPRPKTSATVEKVVPAKRQASDSSDEESNQYAELRDLENEQASPEMEKAEISKRQADRKREEDEDTRRLLETDARGVTVDEMESQLLKGKSAQWLLAYQREHKRR